MEEFMRLYEKQQRLDEETKLKLANMQEHNGKLRREIEELRKTENELLKDHLEHWKHIKALHMIGVAYPHRAKEPNLTSQGVATIVDNATKNANAADALLLELEQTVNTTSSPRAPYKAPILRVTKGGKKVPPNYCFQFNDTNGYCSYPNCNFIHLIYNEPGTPDAASAPTTSPSDHSQPGKGPAHISSPSHVANNNSTTPSTTPQDTSQAGDKRKPIDAEAEWDRRYDSTSDSYGSARTGTRLPTHTPDHFVNGNGELSRGRDHSRSRRSQRSRSRSRSRSQSRSRSNSRSRVRRDADKGYYREERHLDRDFHRRDDRDRYLSGSNSSNWGPVRGDSREREDPYRVRNNGGGDLNGRYSR